MSSLKQNLIRAALESSELDPIDTDNQDVQAESAGGQTGVQSISEQQAALTEAIDATTDEGMAQTTVDAAAVESMFSHLGRLHDFQAAVESYTALPMNDAVMNALSVGLEAAENEFIEGEFSEVEPDPNKPAEKLTITPDSSVSDQIKAAAADLGADKPADSQATSKSIGEKIKALWDKLVKFMTEMWNRVSLFVTKMFSSAQALKMRISRQKTRMSKLDMSNETRGPLKGDSDKLKNIATDLSYRGQYSHDVRAVLGAVKKVQDAVNGVEDTMVKKYDQDHERFMNAMRDKRIEQLIQILVSDVPMPNGFHEIASPIQFTRQWSTDEIVGGYSWSVYQSTLVTRGVYRTTVFTVKESHKKSDKQVDVPEAMSKADIAHVHEMLGKILSDTELGKSVVARAAKNIQKTRKMPNYFSGASVAAYNAFTGRYHSIGRATVMINARLLKCAARYLDLVDMTLDTYKER